MHCLLARTARLLKHSFCSKPMRNFAAALLLDCRLLRSSTTAATAASADKQQQEVPASAAPMAAAATALGNTLLRSRARQQQAARECTELKQALAQLLEDGTVSRDSLGCNIVAVLDEGDEVAVGELIGSMPEAGIERCMQLTQQLVAAADITAERFKACLNLSSSGDDGSGGTDTGGNGSGSGGSAPRGGYTGLGRLDDSSPAITSTAVDARTWVALVFKS
jgi:uncharacterized protein YjiS (DUF1127 family)